MFELQVNRFVTRRHVYIGLAIEMVDMQDQLNLTGLQLIYTGD